MKHKYLCLPKQPQATKPYFFMKLFLQLVFLLVFIFEVTCTVYFMRFYRQRVQDVKDSSIFPSRSEIQVLNTHAHFFLFAGLLNGAAILIGFWAIMMEYLVILAGYSYIHSVVIGFEIIGAWMSGDHQIYLYKGISIAPQPFLVFLGLIFAHMVRESEKRLAHSPIYKQQQAMKAGRGETMSDPNYKLPSEKKTNDIEGGYENPAMNQSDHNTPRTKQPQPSTSSGSAYHSEMQAEIH